MAETVLDRKSAQLGMPLGTAQARLRKIVVLSVLQEVGEDLCYRCDGRIETPVELGYDHRTPWFNVAPALFWDLQNVVFSHRACNKVDRTMHGLPRGLGPRGITDALKAQQLGMPFATATNRLKKLVLFNLLDKHGMARCFKCEGPILTDADLNHEHKKPWFGRDTALFWDPVNVAFSHRSCNRPDVERGPRAEAPPGMAWCGRHRAFLPVDLFGKRSNRWNGLREYCRDCASLDNAKRYTAKT